MSFDRPLLAPVNIGRGAHRRLVGRGADREFGDARLRLDPRQIGFARRASRAHLGRDGDERYLARGGRSEEHTSELQSLMRISYAVFCLKKKTKTSCI